MQSSSQRKTSDRTRAGAKETRKSDRQKVQRSGDQKGAEVLGQKTGTDRRRSEIGLKQSIGNAAGKNPGKGLKGTRPWSGGKKPETSEREAREKAIAGKEGQRPRGTNTRDKKDEK